VTGGAPAEPAGPRLRTDRLLLRPWRPEDRPPFAALNADPETMRFFPSTLSRPESDALAERREERFESDGFGLWAVEVPDAAPFIGFVGLLPVLFEAPFTPAVEIGWRLARPHWRQGYATEAARAALRFAFEVLQLDEVVSFTAAINEPSRAVMARLGMHRDPSEDFVHPRIATDHRLQPHVLYRLGRQDWSGP
jgi:RimJ/RimL family protein N-acetyltransferase